MNVPLCPLQCHWYLVCVQVTHTGCTRVAQTCALIPLSSDLTRPAGSGATGATSSRATVSHHFLYLIDLTFQLLLYHYVYESLYYSEISIVGLYWAQYYCGWWLWVFHEWCVSHFSIADGATMMEVDHETGQVRGKVSFFSQNRGRMRDKK